ncbi:hypothetical protein OEZ86_000736 [Tetradesmus obliquus]|nr:hypothetical protein OEZ86_000736 [Tetradesmus obliquus]
MWLHGLIALVLVAGAQGSFEVEVAGLKIVHPSNDRGRMNVALANFGEPKYGAALVGQIIYPNPSSQYSSHAYACMPAACNYGCSFFNESQPPFKIEKKPGQRYIMLLDRGPRDHTGLSRPCYFIDKAYHAQMAGADALLVVNDGPGDLSTAVAPKDEDSTRELAQIGISSGLISEADGNAIKELLRKGPVSVALNWTDVLPKANKVSWEFWTNSNDECGLTCDKQKKFVKDFKPIAKKMESAGLITFQPHYLLWVCQYGAESDECKTQCIRQGAYCCPDPDDNILEGYSGAEVLLMNVRSLCFARVARDQGEPWLWWEYADKMGESCKMSNKSYTPECSEQVFKSVVEGTKLAGDAGLKAWKNCLDFGDVSSSDPIKMLDEELAAQTGNDAETTIAILPTVQVNARQYRGVLEAPSVLRAICTGFPTGNEPAVCNEEWVSDNECKEGNEGWTACNSGLNSTLGRTRCVNTFTGYACECGEGFMKVVDAATGVDTCSEINECLVSSVPWTKDACKCDRCACLNTVGSYNCTGPLPNMCTAEHNYGNCWKDTINGKLYTACKDTIKLYKWQSQYGILNETTPTFECSCPACFRELPGGGCEPACDLSHCDGQLGCFGPVPEPGGSGSHSSKGVSVGTVFMLLLLSVAVTAGGMFAVYQVHLRKRMHADMRNILEEYVPLNSAPSAAGPSSISAVRKFSAMIPESFTDVVTPRISTAMSTALSAGTPRALSGAEGLNASLSLSLRSESGENQ